MPLGLYHLAVPMITWEPHGIALEDILAGHYDDYMRRYFEYVREACPNNDVMIRFAHEMETRPQYQFEWYEWQGLDPQLYIAAWRHVVALGREVCPNIKWVWSPNHADEYADPYYPGDEYVDYVGVTLNLTTKEFYDTHYESAQDYYVRAGQRDWHRKYGKPAILSEYAFVTDDIEHRIDYFGSIREVLDKNPHLRAVVFLDYDNKENELRDFKFSDEPELFRLFIDTVKRAHGVPAGDAG